MASWGEARHGVCIYGALKPVREITDRGERLTTLMLCEFPLAEPVPPALKRVWTGAVNPNRDCIACEAHREAGDAAT